MTRRFWTASEIAYLRERYPDTPTAAIAQALGRPLSSVYQQAAKLGFVKSAAYLAGPHACRLRRGDNVGAASRFPKGHVPANKGLRRPGWGPGRMKSTQFKPGHATYRWMPIGSRRLIEGYVYIKLADVRKVPYTVNWFPEHVITWEMAHGRPVPPKHAVRFCNGDRTDMRPENLELVARADLMRRNSVHNLPAPLPQTIQLLGALKRQIRRRDATEQDRRPA